MSDSSIDRSIRWNLGLIIAVGLYGFFTDEPYWRDTGHGPWLYDYLFWLVLVFNGPSGFAADYLLWLQWKGYHRLALWCRGRQARQRMLYGAALLLTLAGAAGAYQAWVFGHRP